MTASPDPLSPLAGRGSCHLTATEAKLNEPLARGRACASEAPPKSLIKPASADSP